MSVGAMIKEPPRYGYFPRWPEDGDDWIDPEDVAIVRGMIPSMRIWRREGTSGPLDVLHYGDIQVRVRRALWVEVEPEGIEIGDTVEVLSRMRKNTYRIGTVCDMLWDPRTEAITYHVQSRRRRLPNVYRREDLRPVEPVTKTMPADDARED